MLGNQRQGIAKETDHFHWLFNHLQHRDIESLRELAADAAVLDHLPLRPHLDERWRPRPTSGAGAVLWSPWGGVRSVHLWVRVMGHCSQHRSHRLLLVSPPRAQTALPSPRSPAGVRLVHNRNLRALVTLGTKRLVVVVVVCVGVCGVCVWEEVVVVVVGGRRRRRGEGVGEEGWWWWWF